MKSILGIVGGGFLGILIFVALYWDALVGNVNPGIIGKLYLANLENYYLFGGALLGLLAVHLETLTKKN